jgi:hypothetical protein
MTSEITSAKAVMIKPRNVQSSRSLCSKSLNEPVFFILFSLPRESMPTALGVKLRLAATELHPHPSPLNGQV